MLTRNLIVEYFTDWCDAVEASYAGNEVTIRTEKVLLASKTGVQF